MKKKIILILITLLLGVSIYIFINNKPSKYKKELQKLGYPKEEINIITEEIDEKEVENHLLEKKYKDLKEFIKSDLFNISNIERYQNYKDKTECESIKCVIEVELGLDNPFYTNIIDTDITKKELMIVNKYNTLSSNYVPDLVKVESGYGSGKADKVAYVHFKDMVDAAKNDGIKLKSVSFYRSYSTQKNLYDRYKKKDGIEKADTYSARPGHSEHQTGLGVDINTASSSANFQNTKEYEWLINNSYKYGYILRYPKNKTYITGYKYEPWHYRYVGVEAATKIHELSLTYEEYYLLYILKES